MWADAGVCFQSSEILTHHTQPARKHENTLPLGSRLQEGLLARPPACPSGPVGAASHLEATRDGATCPRSEGGQVPTA